MKKKMEEGALTKTSIGLASVVIEALLTMVSQGSIGVALAGVDIAYPNVEWHQLLTPVALPWRLFRLGGPVRLNVNHGNGR
jgi:hypothetical protein